MQSSDFWTRITSLYGSQTSPVILCTQSACLASESLVSMGPRPHLWFWRAKQRLLGLNYNSLWVPDLTCDFVHAISVPSIRITSLYGSQTSSVVLACKTETFGPELQFSMGLRPQLSFGVCITAWLAPELQVSMGPRPHLQFCACKTECLASELLVSMGPRPYMSFCACKTAWLASELLVSMCPSPHLRFLHAKQRLLDQNNKSPWLPEITCRFVHAKQRDYHQNY